MPILLRCRRRVLFSGPLLALFSIAASFSPPSATELSVGPHPSKIVILPGQPVPLDSSAGRRKGAAVACNRVHIHGLSRLRNLTKFAHSLKVKVSVAPGDSLFRAQNLELCFHRNASLGIGMCAPSQWQKLSKGSWARSVSPYGNAILDIRIPTDLSSPVEVSTEEEFLFHRVVFLVLGTVMMAAARFLSESVVFYYSSAMAVGIILVMLMVLFQGMRLLPTGRKSSLAIFLYSSLVGVATFLLSYMSGLLRSILVELGISEDMHNPLGILLLACFVLAGAWFGYWGVRKLVLTEDGLVDSGVAYFVEWAILIFAAVMILQCSLDTLFAAEALVIVMTIARTRRKFKFLRRLFGGLAGHLSRVKDQLSPTRSSPAEYTYRGQRSETQRRHSKLASCTSPQDGMSASPKTPLSMPYEEGIYYSTFHKTPERKRFSKEEWETFTKDHTRKALRDLVSSPDFSRWATENAERIMVTPPEHHRHERKHNRFYWF